MMIVKFWQSTNHKDKVTIDPNSLYEFLSANGFRCMTYGDDNAQIPVLVNGNIVEKKSLNDLFLFTADI